MTERLTRHCMGFPGDSDGKESARSAGDLGWKIPWRREWLSTPVFLSGESHGQRSLAGCSPWGQKESDTTERLTHYTVYLPILLFSLNLQPSQTGSVLHIPKTAASVTLPVHGLSEPLDLIEFLWVHLCSSVNDSLPLITRAWITFCCVALSPVPVSELVSKYVCSFSSPNKLS